MATAAPMARLAVGSRRDHLRIPSSADVGLARTGSPRWNRARSSAKAAAEG